LRNKNPSILLWGARCNNNNNNNNNYGFPFSFSLSFFSVGRVGRVVVIFLANPLEQYSTILPPPTACLACQQCQARSNYRDIRVVYPGARARARRTTQLYLSQSVYTHQIQLHTHVSSLSPLHSCTHASLSSDSPIVRYQVSIAFPSLFPNPGPPSSSFLLPLISKHATKIDMYVYICICMR